MGCSCSKATDSVVSEDMNDIRLSGIRESHDIYNGGFVGVDKDNSYEASHLLLVVMFRLAFVLRICFSSKRIIWWTEVAMLPFMRVVNSEIQIKEALFLLERLKPLLLNLSTPF